jgi:hypothetical protein
MSTAEIVARALATIDAAQGDAREALRQSVVSGKVKASVELTGITWAEWLSLPIPSRDRITLHAWRG